MYARSVSGDTANGSVANPPNAAAAGVGDIDIVIDIDKDIYRSIEWRLCRGDVIRQRQATPTHAGDGRDHSLFDLPEATVVSVSDD
jgi:hypothetical protein